MLNREQLLERREVLLSQLQRLMATIPNLQAQSDQIKGQINLIDELLGGEPQEEPEQGGEAQDG
jgi:hypothetical protein